MLDASLAAGSLGLASLGQSVARAARRRIAPALGSVAVPNVVFVAPYLLDATARFVDGAMRVPGARVALVTSEPPGKVDAALARALAGYVHVDDCLDAGQLRAGVAAAGERLGGGVDRLLGILEDLQVPLAEVREALRIVGMDASEAANFRDKARMKDVLRAAGVPCARHGPASSVDEARAAAAHCGFPLVVKPPAGRGAQGTFRVDGGAQLDVWLAADPPTPARPAQIEELVVGDELSFDAVTIGGEMVWHSINHYLPSPLTVLDNPWIQWCVVLPRDIGGPEFAGIRHAGPHALHALGMVNGLSHMEWFRRPDGSVAVSEVGARPPGAQFSTLISLAHDFDLYGAWPHLMIHDEFDPPTRRWAVGAAYLRPMGPGRIGAVHGIDRVPQWVHDVVVTAKLPEPGQSTSSSYEGDGFVIVRHRETDVVEQALNEIITTLRVELA